VTKELRIYAKFNIVNASRECQLSSLPLYSVKCNIKRAPNWLEGKLYSTPDEALEILREKNT